jgi:hypothetical protein
MAQFSTHERQEEELVDENFSTTQQLALHINSHKSTLTFTLDTLSQYHTLINRLQYEVEFLRCQGEHVEAKLEAKPPNSSAQSQNEEIGRKEDPKLPYLNIALEPPP